jgi:hypothetical protein
MDFRIELAKVAPNVRKGGRIFVFGAGENWRKIRHRYKVTTGTNLEDFVDAFVDNDSAKLNIEFFGKKIISPKEIDQDYPTVLVAAATNDYSIERQLVEMGFYCNSNFFPWWCFEEILRKYLYTQIMRFKNKHKNERCFIIGNGPSLTASDLDRLKDETTFAVNNIHVIFDKTVWRPTYYLAADPLVLEGHQTINERIKCDKFFFLENALMHADFYAPGSYYFGVNPNPIRYRPSPHRPVFSIEPDAFGEGYNMVYICLQMAAFMGFKRIYLLGVDGDFPVSIRYDGEIVFKDVDHYFSNNYATKQSLFFIPCKELAVASFESAREYAESHGIEIFNATRGGKLEVYARVGFDNLHSGE